MQRSLGALIPVPSVGFLFQLRFPGLSVTGVTGLITLSGSHLPKRFCKILQNGFNRYALNSLHRVGWSKLDSSLRAFWHLWVPGHPLEVCPLGDHLSPLQRRGEGDFKTLVEARGSCRHSRLQELREHPREPGSRLLDSPVASDPGWTTLGPMVLPVGPEVGLQNVWILR